MFPCGAYDLIMSRERFASNISGRGRLVRAVLALGLFGGGCFCLRWHPWATVILFLSSAFVFFEAAKGWCALRACGIRTKL